jgi:hypothetical protein
MPSSAAKSRRMRRALIHAFFVPALCHPAYAQGAERGTAEGTIHGRKVTVEYGRAVLKGRSLDSLISQLPEDRVWRAGADEVTTLKTEVDLSVDGLRGSSCSRSRVPGAGRTVRAGTYSVYVSAPLEAEWSLILNSDRGIELGSLAGILGFEVPSNATAGLWPHLEGYNMNRAKGVAGIAAREVARIPLTAGSADPPVDPFTIRLEPAGLDALTLTLAWADKTLSVDLNAARPLQMAAGGTGIAIDP